MTGGVLIAANLLCSTGGTTLVMSEAPRPLILAASDVPVGRLVPHGYIFPLAP